MPEIVEELFHHVLWHSVLDTLKLLPFLFLTYLMMEAIEHKAADKVDRMIRHAGPLGPLAGGLLGLVPQCGFSAAAASLYAGRVITVGTMVAVFLATSDEMLPLMISGGVRTEMLLLTLAYKLAVALAVGLTLDLLLRLCHKEKEPLSIDEVCERENCQCEHGILLSALLHTLRITLFIFLFTVAIGAIVHFVGTDAILSLTGIPVLSHIIMALLGMIPNCAASVALTTAHLNGLISFGAMMAGLLPGTGVGILVLFRNNRHLKQNLLLILLLLLCGVLFGLLADLLPFPSLR